MTKSKGKKRESAQEKANNKPAFDPRAVLGLGDSTDDVDIEESLLDPNNANALVMPGRREKKPPKKKEEEPEPKKPLSKSKQKRLAKLEETRMKKARRAELMESLAKNNLSQNELQLMRSSKQLGHKDTLKERLSRALKEERAGIVQSVEVDLYKEKKESAQEVTESDEGEEEEVEEDDDVEMEEVTPAPKRPPVDNSETVPTKKTKREPVSSGDPSDIGKVAASNRAAPAMIDPLSGAGIGPGTKAKAPGKKAFYVKLQRHHKIAAARMELPVVAEEQAIMEAITENDVVIICGETGSGKTTQVPQFLYEAGYGNKESGNPGMIGVTQPRRVATVSMAKRVAEELGSTVAFGRQVSYQIRYDTNVSNKTQVKFMTDGVLLKEMQSDFLLKKYSAIVLDEAHERNINTDILIGLLSRLVPMRSKMAADQAKKHKSNPNSTEVPLTPLKLIIMSATLRVSDFTENTTLFDCPPPVINVNARQYPVVSHFARRTVDETYADEAMKKVIRIHRKLPPGGILVFLTGAQEIEVFCNKLRSRFSKMAARRKNRKEAENMETEVEEKSIAETLNLKASEKGDDVEAIDLGEWNLVPEKKTVTTAATMEESEMVVGGDGTLEDLPAEVADEVYEAILSDDEVENDEGSDDDSDDDGKFADVPVCVLPLYSMLAPEKQMKVFEAEKILTRARLVVVATNVAETSITIPGIKYVVDAGKHKERVYENRAGLSRFQIDWISKASADQRSGRAGRTGPGHCYRLYSSAVFDRQFPQFSDPEILKAPIEGVVLQLKTMGIEKVDKFPFPTPPDEESVLAADKLLVNLGAVDPTTKKITALGRTLANFPVNPRFAKMLLVGDKDGCLPYTVALVAAMSVRDPFIRNIAAPEKEKESNANDGKEDNDQIGNDRPEIDMRETEEDDWDDFESMDEDHESKEAKKKKEAQMRASQAMQQWMDEGSDLLAVLNAFGAYVFAGCNRKFCIDNALHAKTMVEIHHLYKQLARIVNGFLLPGATKVPKALDALANPPSPSQRKILRQIITAGFVDQVVRLVPKDISEDKVRTEYMVTASEDRAYIHPASFIKSKNKHEFLVYNELVETRRPYIKGVTIIEPEWLPDLCPPLTTLSKVMDLPPPNFDASKDECYWFVTPTYGFHQWTLPVRREVVPAGLQRIKYFARFLLEGKVFPKLDIKGLVNENPSVITKDWAKPKIAAIIQPLVDQNIDSRQALLRKWSQDKSFLMAAFMMWTQNAFKKKLSSMWPLKYEGESKKNKKKKTDDADVTILNKVMAIRDVVADDVEHEL